MIGVAVETITIRARMGPEGPVDPRPPVPEDEEKCWRCFQVQISISHEAFQRQTEETFAQGLDRIMATYKEDMLAEFRRVNKELSES